MNLARLPPVPPGPHALADATVAAALKALVMAWSLLPDETIGKRRFGPRDYEDEDLVTSRLVGLLARIHSSGILKCFTARSFEVPARDAKHANHNRKRIDMMPDVVFRPRAKVPTGVDEHFGLFVECKVIGVRRKRVPLYVGKGMARFLDGDYAWAMNRGVMVGFVLGGQALPDDLDAYFRHPRAARSSMRCRPIAGLSRPGWTQKSPELSAVHVSEHPRGFSIEGAGPGDIELVHMWLVRPPPAGA